MSTKTTDVQLEERGSPAARTRDGTRHGFIVPIGGAEEKIGDSRILTRFVELCGGEHAYIVVIPTASELDDTGTRYEDVFSRTEGHVRTALLMLLVAAVASLIPAARAARVDPTVALKAE